MAVHTSLRRFNNRNQEAPRRGTALLLDYFNMFMLLKHGFNGVNYLETPKLI